jgi:hypothetical protein
MLSTSPNIPNQVDPENRFISQLKALLRLYAQELNKLEERIKTLEKKQ